MDFIIDTTGSQHSEPPNVSFNSERTDTDSIVKRLLKEYKDSLDEDAYLVQQPLKFSQAPKGKSQEDDDPFKKFCAETPRYKKGPKKSKDIETLTKHDIKKVLEKSVLTPDFEKLHSIPAYDVSERALKRQRKKEREKTKGSKWFGLPATEVTEEVKNDLEVLQMRSVLDPKHFYKKNDLKVLPKYFQIGKVMDSPLDFYNNRLTRKERKKTLVDELLADANFSRYNKRKYAEIIQEKQKTHYKAYRQAKKLKKRRK